jgi:hypothetical protein
VNDSAAVRAGRRRALVACPAPDLPLGLRSAAILARFRHTCRSNWLASPKDEDLEW